MAKTVWTWKCPKCKSRNLDVSIETWARLKQYGADDFGTDVDEARQGDHEWDAESLMQCRECDYTAPSLEFETKHQRAAAIAPVRNPELDSKPEVRP